MVDCYVVVVIDAMGSANSSTESTREIPIIDDEDEKDDDDNDGVKMKLLELNSCHCLGDAPAAAATSAVPFIFGRSCSPSWHWPWKGGFVINFGSKLNSIRQQVLYCIFYVT